MGLRPARAGVLLAVGVLVAAGVLVAGPVLPAQAAAPVVTVTGDAVFDATLEAAAVDWVGPVSYRWLRDGSPLAAETSRTHHVDLEDLDHRLSVSVTGVDATGVTQTVTSAETDPVDRAVLETRRAPAVRGVLRFGRSVKADPGRWTVDPTRIRFQWYRSGAPVDGATGPSYTIAPVDVGSRLRVKVTVKAPGYLATTATSPRVDRVGHRVDVRRTVTYHVETRGAITTSLAEFRRQAQETYADPRGWRGSGIRFVPVEAGGSFTLVLSQASLVPSFSSACSSTWSCRVGRYVIVNQDRWRGASPAWNAANGALRGYRDMVVNHETGHWLGLSHAGCPGPGRLAPVMMQQSKGLDGCRFNPWPTLGEIAGRTPPARLLAAGGVAVVE